MKKYLLLGLSLALASCATQRQLTPPANATSGGHEERPAYTPTVRTPRPDSVVIARPPSLLDKLLDREPKPYHVAMTPARIGKKSTINVYNAPATVTTLGKKATGAVGDGATATVIEKKAGPAIVASDSSTSNYVAGGNLAAVNGNDNQLEQKAEHPPEKSLLQIIWDEFKPALLIIAGVLGIGAVSFALVNTPAGPWLVGLFKRRKSSTDNA